MSSDLPPTSPGSRNRAFSFRSDKSSGSKGSKPKLELTESAKEKERRDSIWKSTSKANPNAALGEAQPTERATFEQTTIDSLRDTQHKDANGNLIAEPDLSNPTRPRWERPLDTIRSFEKNIDHGYRRRSSMRSESYNNGNSNNNNSSNYNNNHNDQSQYASRRNSYFRDGYDQGPSSNRYSQVGNGGGYYANRSPGGYENGMGGPSRQRYGNRMQSDGNVRYPGNSPHGYQNSHDTVNTGGSDSTGPWANSTDPSSENSSLDRVNAAMKPQQDGYPSNSYGSPPIMEEQGSGSYGAYPQQNGGQRPMGAPPVQPPNGGRRPIPLGSSAGGSLPPSATKLPPSSRAEPEKRKSWLKRRFSKKE